MRNAWIVWWVLAGASCATALGNSGGSTRSDVRVSRGHYVVDIAGEGQQSRVDLEARLRRRAAELCAGDGFSAFDLEISEGKQGTSSARQYRTYSQYTEDPQSSWLRERGAGPAGVGSLSATVSCRMLSDNGTTPPPR